MRTYKALVWHLGLACLTATLMVESAHAQGFGGNSFYRGGNTNIISAGGFGGYGGGYGWGFGMPDIYGGTLSGAADVYNAQGQYKIQRQQARLTREQVESAKLDNRRRKIDEWLYERKVLPTPEEERQRNLAMQVSRARNQPPSTEVWSGYSLNTLLDNLAKMQSMGIQGRSIPLNQDMLGHINVTPSNNQSSDNTGVGVLKHGDDIDWPDALEDDMFKAARETFQSHIKDVLGQVSSGKRPPSTQIRALKGSLNGLMNDLRAQVKNIPTGDYITARRFLTELESAVDSLSKPGATNYFNGTWRAQGQTVDQLVKYMVSNGLRFAAATEGDHAAYTALHTAMAAYDSHVAQLASAAGGNN